MIFSNPHCADPLKSRRLCTKFIADPDFPDPYFPNPYLPNKIETGANGSFFFLMFQSMQRSFNTGPVSGTVPDPDFPDPYFPNPYLPNKLENGTDGFFFFLMFQGV
jgi:hypothetical protein